MIQHPIDPVFDDQSHILILGSFPSVRSRQEQFFYGHPRNRFWSVLAAVFNQPVPTTIPEKRAFLLRHHIALWDVIASCDITGSADSSIDHVVPNDMRIIFSVANIQKIYVNGKTAEKYYRKFLQADLGIQAVPLPSTSPANAGWSMEDLVQAWRILRK